MTIIMVILDKDA